MAAPVPRLTPAWDRAKIKTAAALPEIKNNARCAGPVYFDNSTKAER